MDHLREGIGLVGYAQKKPIDEYKRAGFAMFQDLMFRISKEAVTTFFRAHFGLNAPRREARKEASLSFLHGDEGDSDGAAPAKKPVRKAARLGRNDPCHCGSGKKYKVCHMPLERRQVAN